MAQIRRRLLFIDSSREQDGGASGPFSGKSERRRRVIGTLSSIDSLPGPAYASRCSGRQGVGCFMISALARCGHRLGEPPRDGGDAPWTTQVIKVIIKCSCDMQNDFCGKRERFLDVPFQFEDSKVASFRAHERRIKPKFQPSTIVLNCFTLTVSLRTSDFLSPLRCCTCLRTMKP